MEEPINPYAAGQVHQEYADPTADMAVTPVALNAILKTRVWVKLTGIIFFVLMAIMVLMTFFGSGGDFQRAPGVTAVIMVAILGIYMLMAVRLLQYAKAIEKLRVSLHPDDLARAMEVQTKFWRLVGIVIVVIMVLYFFAIFAAIAVGSRY